MKLKFSKVEILEFVEFDINPLLPSFPFHLTVTAVMTASRKRGNGRGWRRPTRSVFCRSE